MRKPLLALLLVAGLSPSAAHADIDGYLTQVPPAPLKLSARGGTMKRHGIAASALGIIQLSIGMVSGIVSIIPCHSSSADGCQGNIVPFAMGATFTTLGGITTTVGIPMWVYGAREEREAKLRLSATANGLRLTF